MSIKTVVCVFGTRPEAVKMAPIVLDLRVRPDEFRCVVVVTAQHRHMLDQVLNLFGIVPDHDLDLMQDRQSLTDITVRALERLQPVWEREKPDLVLVHGDTTTTLAAALSAFYHKIPVGHVEAGLRSFDMDNPYPEEANRCVTDVVSTLYFAPTPLSRQHLLDENVDGKHIYVTGNSGIDALKMGIKRIDEGSYSPGIANLAALDRDRYILITAHRRENHGQPLENFCNAVRRVARERTDVGFIYPVHLNPRVLEPVHRILGGLPNVHLLEPLDYGDFLHLLRNAFIVLTDSGGLQEEAPSLGKPVAVLRKVTERPEAVEAGTVQLIGTDTDVVYDWIVQLLDDCPLYRRMSMAVNPYGDGQAARRTVEAIRYYFGLRSRRPREFLAEGSNGPKIAGDPIV